MITSQQQKDLIFKKQLSLKYATNNQQYEAFCRTIANSPILYPHDFHVYNDHVQERHLRNQRELQYLKQLLKEDKISPQMLKFNTVNAFYPSYILSHHFDTFLPLISAFQSQPQIRKLVELGKEAKILGALLIKKQLLDCSKPNNSLPILNEAGIIQMNKFEYFYQSVSSPYISHCALLVSSKGGQNLVIIEVRDAKGNIKKQITLKDFGSLTTLDYIPIGYNFSGVKPALILSRSEDSIKKINSSKVQLKLNEFEYSLKDLQKSLWITIKYTDMRRQFKNVENSKQERKIITYQAVGARIIKGFAELICLANFNLTLKDNPLSAIIISQLIPSAHHIVLESLIHLRECCGGFGFMQFSGHPGCIERVSYRAGQQKNEELKLSPIFLQATQYYTSSEEAEKYYSSPVGENPGYMGYFGLFIAICVNMRNRHQKMNHLEFRREYLKQSSIFSSHVKEQYSRNQVNNLHTKLHQFSLYNYILQHPAFLPQNLLLINKLTFYQGLQALKNTLIEELSSHLVELGQTLELHYLRNVIVGREDEASFYKELFEKSKDNLRNKQQYRREVVGDIVSMLNEKARL